MADDITVRERELTRGADAVNATRSGIEDRFAALQHELDSLREVWRGHEGDAVAVGMERCQEEADRLRAAFAALESTLRSSAHEQAETVPSLRRRISGLSSLMSA